MNKKVPVLVLAGLLVLGAGCERRAQAGVVCKEEVLFMEIPQVVAASIKAGPVGHLSKFKDILPNEQGGKE